VPRPVHGHPVGAEAGDPVVLRAFVKEVAPGGVVDYGGQLLHPQVVGPGHGHVTRSMTYSRFSRSKCPYCIAHASYLIVMILQQGGGGDPLRILRSFAAGCRAGREGRKSPARTGPDGGFDRLGLCYRWMRPEPSPPASFSTSDTVTML